MGSKKVSKIGVLTSGGDAPGMNAAIRAVVRTGIYNGLEVFGIMRGYSGMIDDDIHPMNSRSVANIIQRGGTILKTARSMVFMEAEGRKLAYENLRKRGIDGLVIIGGDGSFKGAQKFSNEFDIPCIGLPGTIDKDIAGSDFTIGFDTAVNTAVEAIDKIRDTADAHDRLFIVEVMGRDCGLIALRSGIGVGAESILIPETKTDINAIIHRLEISRKDKSSKIIMVAEGDDAGGAFEVAEIIKARFPNYDTKVSILGHIQRGGKPTCMDRVLASRVGVAAVEGLLKGEKAQMVGLINGKIAFTPFDHAIKHNVEVNEHLLKIVEILSL